MENLSPRGQTIVHLVVINTNTDILSFLLTHKKCMELLNKKNKSSLTPMELAIELRNNSVEIFKKHEKRKIWN